MKKYLCLLLVSIMLIGLSGCINTPAVSDGSGGTTTTTTNTNDTSTELMTLAIVEEVPDDAPLCVDSSVGTYNYTLALTAQQDLFTVRVAKVYDTSAAVVTPLYTLRTLLKGETVYVRTYINDTAPKRGVAFKDKNNMVYVYAFAYSGKDGSVKLQLQSKTEDKDTYVATEEDKAALTAMVTDKDNNGFLQSNYNYSDEISLSALFYDGAGVGTFGTADWSEQEKQDVLTATGWDDFHNPPLKIKRTDANRFIKDKLSPYANPTDEKMYEAFCYVSKYDAFYAMHGDTNYTAVTVKDVQYDPKGYFAVTYTVEGATPVEGVVTLSRTDTGFRFRSNSRADLSKSATPKMEYTPPKTYSGNNVADATGVPYSNVAPTELTNQMARELVEVLLPRQKDVQLVFKHHAVEYDEKQTCACSEWSYRVTDPQFKTLQDVRDFILSVYTGDTADWHIHSMLEQEWDGVDYSTLPTFHEHDGVLYYRGGATGINEAERLWDTTHIVWVKGDVVWVEMHARYDETKEYDHVYTFALCKTADGWRTYNGFMDSYYPS